MQFKKQDVDARHKAGHDGNNFRRAPGVFM
jgi:hypothetical protein